MSTKNLISLVAALLASGHLAAAHMEMQFPAPFKSKYNQYSGQDIDYSMTSPLNADGSNYPCKGYQSVLGTSEGTSTATFTPGQQYNATIVGGAPHAGGSCQFSLSYDQGKTFTTIGTIEGGCPVMTSGNFDFTIPSDAAAGSAVFAWSWFNNEGNREMYMNCASVTIAGGSKKRHELGPRDTPFAQRPPIFEANIGNACTTVASEDVKIPNPGPDVVVNNANAVPPSGSCGSSSGGGAAPAASGAASSAAAPASSSSAAAPAPAPSSTTAPAAAAPSSSAPAVSSAASSSSAAAASVAPDAASPSDGGVFVTIPTDGSGSVASATGGSSASAATSSSAAQTTLATVTTTPAAGGASADPTVAASSSTTAAAAPSGSASAGSGSSGGGSTLSGACSDEGAWNCIGGTAFQRCASGMWSATIPMAAGTSCVAGESDTLTYGKEKREEEVYGRRRGARRYASPWVM